MNNFAFFGSPTFAHIILEKLLKQGWVPKVLICSPDAPIGRKGIITPPATKQLIKERNLDTTILQPATKKELSEQKDVFKTCDVALITAYAKIIPQEVLDVFSKGVIGIHPSLLPSYRGPTPIQTAILDGVTKTGVTLYMVDEQVDHGPILAQEDAPVPSDATYEVMEKILAEIAVGLILNTLPKHLDGTINPTSQNEDNATKTHKFTIEDGFVDLVNDDPQKIIRTILALNPEPGVWTMLDKKRTKLNKIQKKGGIWTITNITPEGKKAREISIPLPYSSNTTE